MVGWHPVPGAKWFSDSGIGKLITEKINKYPDPTQHWAVLVGEYAHQLWMVSWALGRLGRLGGWGGGEMAGGGSSRRHFCAAEATVWRWRSQQRSELRSRSAMRG
jgi:hypothetical protein